MKLNHKLSEKNLDFDQRIILVNNEYANKIKSLTEAKETLQKEVQIL